MANYTLDTDFRALKPAQAQKWMCEFCGMAEKAFDGQGTGVRLLGNLLLLEAYINTIRRGLEKQDTSLCPLIPKGLEMLTSYLDGRVEAASFRDFASNLYACVLHYNTGEEIPEAQEAFYEENFGDDEFCASEWSVLEWIGGLMLELAVLDGEELDFDFYEEFEDVEKIDLFYKMEDMMNDFADSCANVLQIHDQTMMEVYQTEPYQNVVGFVCDVLKAAVHAEPEQYAALQQECREMMMVPEEYAAELVRV